MIFFVCLESERVVFYQSGADHMFQNGRGKGERGGAYSPSYPEWAVCGMSCSYINSISISTLFGFPPVRHSLRSIHFFSFITNSYSMACCSLFINYDFIFFHSLTPRLRQLPSILQPLRPICHPLLSLLYSSSMAILASSSISYCSFTTASSLQSTNTYVH